MKKKGNSPVGINTPYWPGTMYIPLKQATLNSIVRAWMRCKKAAVLYIHYIILCIYTEEIKIRVSHSFPSLHTKHFIGASIALARVRERDIGIPAAFRRIFWTSVHFHIILLPRRRRHRTRNRIFGLSRVCAVSAATKLSALILRCGRWQLKSILFTLQWNSAQALGRVYCLH